MIILAQTKWLHSIEARYVTYPCISLLVESSDWIHRIHERFHDLVINEKKCVSSMSCILNFYLIGVRTSRKTDLIARNGMKYSCDRYRTCLLLKLHCSLINSAPDVDNHCISSNCPGLLLCRTCDFCNEACYS